MKHTFKTNIHCGSCVQAVSPYLNAELDIQQWEVDTTHADKLLVVEGDVEKDQVIAILAQAGYRAEPAQDK
jgi:copper chaperone